LSGILPAIYGRAFVNQTIPVLDEQGNNTAEMTVEFKEIKKRYDPLNIIKSLQSKRLGL
jgi:hypothetical protein